MSRTTRKPKSVIEETLVQVLNRDKAWYSRHSHFYRSGFKSVRVRKDTAEYLVEVTAAEKKYDALLAEAEKKYGKWKDYPKDSWYYVRYTQELPNPYMKHVSKFKRVDVPSSYEDDVAETIRDYEKRTRDGHWNETGRNKFFKELCNDNLRSENRKLENKILKDEDYDHRPYPNSKTGKKFIWSVW